MKLLDLRKGALKALNKDWPVIVTLGLSNPCYPKWYTRELFLFKDSTEYVCRYTL